MLVTGAVVAVLGTENARGDFEVVDIRLPELPPEPPRWAIAGARNDSNTDIGNSAVPSGPRKIALLSGLELTGTAADMVPLSLLTDYLLGYQTADAAVISRLIIAGNSIAVPEPVTDNAQPPHHKKYGHDAAVYNPSPITRLDSLLSELLPSIPVTVMSGESDPANASLPQQPIHRAMLPRSKPYCAGPPGNKASVGNQVESPDPGWLDMTTNPLEAEIDGWRFWGCSGQNVDDVLRYLDVNIEEGTSGTSGDERLRVMEAMLRWRCPVPTAPDTLCMFPPWSFRQFLSPISIDWVMLTDSFRVLPFPRHRSVRPFDVPTRIFHWQSATFRHRCRRRIRARSRAGKRDRDGGYG